MSHSSNCVSWALTLLLIAACAELGSDSSEGPEQPGTGPKRRDLTMGCSLSQTPLPVILVWELVVDPSRIDAEEPLFAAALAGRITISEELLDDALVQLEYTRTRVLEAQATVHVRSGVAPGTEDVVLGPEPMPWTCAYDAEGDNGSRGATTFPSCTPDNDHEDGANDACTGLGGAPNRNNPCGQFVPLPLARNADECADKSEQFEQRGYCITGDAVIALKRKVVGYELAPPGPVLFGFDDRSTGAVVRPGPNGDTVELPPVKALEPVGPNGLRVEIITGGEPPVLFGFECSMVADSAPLTPMDDGGLIEFAID